MHPPLSAPPTSRVEAKALERATGLADEHGLGPLVDYKQAITRAWQALGECALGGLALLVAAFAFLGILAAGAPPLFGAPLALVALAGGWAIEDGFSSIVTPSTGAYLFSGGLVHRKRGRLEAVPWSAARRVVVQRGSRLILDGRALSYTIERDGGRPLKISGELFAWQRPFGDQLVAAAQAHGVAVADG